MGFEGTCPAGWVLGGDWECGAPTATNGPSAAFAGSQCIATQIDANYSSNQSYDVATATSPVIDLAGLSSATLSFRMWLRTEPGTFDGAHLKISANGGPFQLLTGLTPAYDANVDGQPAWTGDESALGWQPVTADLTSHVGQTIQLRFAFHSDVSISNAGVFIDDVRVIQ